MANDKDFTLTNGIEISKDTKNTVGTISASNAVDLSTGNFFTHTPAGATTYSFTNPGAVQSFQMQLTGGQEAVANSFSTTLYTGNGSTQTITNGINLSGEGGLVWLKDRGSSVNYRLYDTERGATNALVSNATDANFVISDGLTAFNSNGFTLGSSGTHNASNNNFVSWTFKKTSKFFDVVTYTGTGSVQNISHNLGSVPGMIIVKVTSRADGWAVYHRGVNGGTDPEDYVMLLANTNAQENNATFWNDTAPTSTQFTVGTEDMVNKSGENFVAYLFGHETDASSLIKCGSYTGTGSSGNAVTLGWEPQWLMIKNISTSNQNWELFDNQRGLVTNANSAELFPNTSSAERNSFNIINTTATGFETGASSLDETNASGSNYIYVAIRSAAATAVTWPNSVKFQGGLAPQTPAVGEVDTYTFTTRDGGTSYIGVQSGNNHS